MPILYRAQSSFVQDDIDRRLQDHEKSLSISLPICKKYLDTLFLKKPYTELHFFWVTGISQYKLKEEYSPILKVNLGNDETDTVRFFAALDTLLSLKHQNLFVKFTGDTLTFLSNKINFEQLKIKYGTQFEFIDIDKGEKKVIENVIEHYKDLEAYISPALKNAFSGNPAIASDFYRLFALPVISTYLGQYLGHHQDATFTYCDIDTFTDQMAQVDSCNDNWDKKSLCEYLESLFQKNKNNNNFNIGLKSGNNDLIKLNIFNFEVYKSSWQDFFIKKERRSAKSNQIFQDRPQLYQYVKECEQESHLSIFSAFELYLDLENKVMCPLKMSCGHQVLIFCYNFF